MAMIAILTPSRGRPDHVRDLVDSIFSTAADPSSIHLYLGHDDDDHSYDDQLWDGNNQLWYGNVTRYYGGRETASAWTNILAEIAIRDGADILAFFGDDHRPRTNGWDARVREAFDRHGSGLVYTADGLQNERLPTAPFWSASVIKELGWFFPPVLKHMYADDYWLRLGQDLGRVTYLDDVLIEHMHPSVGKADMDDVYRTNDMHIDADRQAFHRFIVEEHPTIVERVRCAL